MHSVDLKMEINSITEFYFTIIPQNDLRNQDIAFNKHSFSKGILTGSLNLFSDSE
jgi:hypothetical protein